MSVRFTHTLSNMSMIIRGTGALSAMGEDSAAHRIGVSQGTSPFMPIGKLMDFSRPDLPAAWIRNRELLNHRKWSPTTMASLHVARQAVAEAGWGEEECKDAVLMFGTSRGGVAGWLEPWPRRRGVPLMAASNAMHGEGAAAISIELGIKGTYQVISTGCSAGVDALGMAMLHLQAGLATRALVVAADLPLVTPLLDCYESTGILSKDGKNDPYHPQTTGIFPAEAAAAMAIELGEGSGVKLLGYMSNSDAADPLSLSPESGQLVSLFVKGVKQFGVPSGLCPHATGTASHSLGESQCLMRAFPAIKPSLHLLKPHIGHGIGAGSLLETVILAEFLRDKQLPPNLPRLTAPHGSRVPDHREAVGGPVWKIAASLGGHNALVAMQAS